MKKFLIVLGTLAGIGIIGVGVLMFVAVRQSSAIAAETTPYVDDAVIDEGRIHSVRVGIEVNTENRGRNSHRGWLLSGKVERAGGTFGGDYAEN